MVSDETYKSIVISVTTCVDICKNICMKELFQFKGGMNAYRLRDLKGDILELRERVVWAGYLLAIGENTTSGLLQWHILIILCYGHRNSTFQHKPVL